MKRKTLYRILGIVGVVAIVASVAFIGRMPQTHDHSTDGGTTGTTGATANNTGSDATGSTGTTANNTGSGATGTTASHSHGQSNEHNYRIVKEQDGTYTATILGTNGKTLFAKKGLARKPLVETVTDDVYSICFVLGAGPNDYENVYCNEKKGIVSDVFHGVLGCDGVRVAYPHAVEDGYAVTVQDLFDKKGYSKTYTLEGAYTGGDYVVVGGRMDGKLVKLSYVINPTGACRSLGINLYE